MTRMRDIPSEFVIRLFGSPGCGKTSLIASLFGLKDLSEVGVKQTNEITIENTQVSLSFYDMDVGTGTKDADILVLCFSVEKYANFGTLMTQMVEARTFAKNNAACVLVGTMMMTFVKVDVRESTPLVDPVLLTDQDALRQSIAAKAYVEVSSTTRDGIEQLSEEVIRIIKERMRGFTIPIRYKVGNKPATRPDNIGNDFEKIIDDRESSDVTLSIIIDPETGEKYSKYCHKLVLAARSPVFKAMFYGGIRNKESEFILNENIRDKRVLDQFVTFIYTNRVPLEKDAEETVIPLLALADEYGTVPLKESCGAFALDKINENNWLDLYEVAKMYNEQSLVNDCLSFVAENIQPILLDTSNYQTLNQETLIDLLQRDDITCNEIDLFNMVVDWYEKNTQRQQDSVFEQKTPSSHVETSEPATPTSALLTPTSALTTPMPIDLPKVMSHIRWVLMGPQKLIIEIKKHIGKYLTMEDYEEAMEFFAVPRRFTQGSKETKFKFRRVLCPFVWDCNFNNFTLSNEDRTITKHGANNWDLVAFSSVAMESGLHYWQVKIDVINSDKSGMSIGLTSDRNLRSDSYNVGTSLGCAGSVYGATSVNSNNVDYMLIVAGDVIGFLVDFIKDENGRIMFTGVQRPSDLKQIYATVFLFYNGDQVSLVNEYPLSMLNLTV
ncbi:BTB/POZ domain-containing protein [Acrasis kona]|uniref:BTB/POZ domain-containing protein n=1 Tax=Acrasis kona TaxID=1008807 RepID=A0AAW2YYK1_9EUKA